LLRPAAGLSVGEPRLEGASGVLMLPIERGGRLVAVEGLDRARAVPGVESASVSVPVGEPLVPLPEGDRYLGFVLARGESAAGVEAALRRAWAELHVVVTAAASTFCLVERHSQHLSFGEFSSKFAAAVAATPHLDAPEVIESAPGTHPEAVAREGVDLYALTHNETSTGVAMEVRRPAGASGLVAVDATSAAGGLRVDAAEFDCYYFAPQ